MKCPCGMIKDLIPLYVDGVCGIESKTAVKEHIAECEKCKNYYDEMSEASGFSPKKKQWFEG